ncbi:MAG: hypothetical protein ACM3H7_03475 [Acidobacteriaceae bacterium]
MFINIAGKYRILLSFWVVIIVIFASIGSIWSKANAQGIPIETPDQESAETGVTDIEVITPYFSIEHTTLPDGMPVSGYIINGPPAPPPGSETESTASIMPLVGEGILPNFPSYSWVFGCSAVSGAMIAAYYDRGAYPNMYTGPANGGVMPLSDSSWPTWSDGDVPNYPNNPLVATHQGVDGRMERGTIDDYWVKYQSTANDPYITGGWAQHTWGNAIGDYMKTSRSAAPYNNEDGGTKFYTYTNNSAKLTCTTMAAQGIAEVDGTYGRKLFYEARGYPVTDCYNQKTDNNQGGFTLANFQAEINAGNPVLLNLAGHSIVGYGYNGSTIYIRDTWSNDPSFTPTMSWGGSYKGMKLLSASVVHLQPAQPATPHPLVLNVLVVLKYKAPTNIILSNSTIPENRPTNTVVGTLSTVDPNAGDTFTYSLVSGAGSTDNGSFNLSGNQLRSSAVFDYETKSSYSVRIRTTDNHGLFFEKAFTITITPSGWETLVNTTFEGDFPGPWEVFDNNGTSYGEYFWAARPCRAYAGSNSGWAVGGGANGTPLSCGGNYPDEADSWMEYGPFSLANATAADLNFVLWQNTEFGYDEICYGASIDGVNFSGVCNDNTGTWIDSTLDLSNVYNLGDLRGQPQVWVAIIFTSDGSLNHAEGGYVDNIVLRRCLDATCPGLETNNRETGQEQANRTPWSATIKR